MPCACCALGGERHNKRNVRRGWARVLSVWSSRNILHSCIDNVLRRCAPRLGRCAAAHCPRDDPGACTSRHSLCQIRANESDDFAENPKMTKRQGGSEPVKSLVLGCAVILKPREARASARRRGWVRSAGSESQARGRMGDDAHATEQHQTGTCVPQAGRETKEMQQVAD